MLGNLDWGGTGTIRVTLPVLPKKPPLTGRITVQVPSVTVPRKGRIVLRV
jgi:hypothetical protein